MEWNSVFMHILRFNKRRPSRDISFFSPFMVLNNADVHIQGLECLRMFLVKWSRFFVDSTLLHKSKQYMLILPHMKLLQLLRLLFHFIAAQPSRCDAAHRGLSEGRVTLFRLFNIVFKGLGFKGRVYWFTRSYSQLNVMWFSGFWYETVQWRACMRACTHSVRDMFYWVYRH